MSRPIDQIDSSHTNTPQLEHDGQPSSGRVLPSTLTVSQRGSVTLLRLSRPAKRNALDEATIAGLETFFSDPPLALRRIASSRYCGRTVSAFSAKEVAWALMASAALC